MRVNSFYRPTASCQESRSRSFAEIRKIAGAMCEAQVERLQQVRRCLVIRPGDAWLRAVHYSRGTASDVAQSAAAVRLTLHAERNVDCLDNA